MKETKLNNVISKLQDTGHVLWQGDDSPRAYSILTNVIRLTDNGGGRVIRLDSNGVKQMTVGTESAGKFLALYE